MLPCLLPILVAEEACHIYMSFAHSREILLYICWEQILKHAHTIYSFARYLDIGW